VRDPLCPKSLGKARMLFVWVPPGGMGGTVATANRASRCERRVWTGRSLCRRRHATLARGWPLRRRRRGDSHDVGWAVSGLSWRLRQWRLARAILSGSPVDQRAQWRGRRGFARAHREASRREGRKTCLQIRPYDRFKPRLRVIIIQPLYSCKLNIFSWIEGAIS
jgi:hypothetical protein